MLYTTTTENEYRQWLISEINIDFETEHLTLKDIETVYESIGCLRPQSSHTMRDVMKQGMNNKY